MRKKIHIANCMQILVSRNKRLLNLMAVVAKDEKRENRISANRHDKNRTANPINKMVKNWLHKLMAMIRVSKDCSKTGIANLSNPLWP